MKLMIKSLSVMKAFKNYQKHQPDNFNPELSDFFSKKIFERKIEIFRILAPRVIMNDVEDNLSQRHISVSEVYNITRLSNFEKQILSKKQKIEFYFTFRKSIVARVIFFHHLKIYTISEIYYRKTNQQKIMNFLKLNRNWNNERNQQISLKIQKIKKKNVFNIFARFIKKRLLLKSLQEEYTNLSMIKNYKKNMKLKDKYLKLWLEAKSLRIQGLNELRAKNFYDSILLLKSFYSLKNHNTVTSRSLEIICSIVEKKILKKKKKTLKILKWKKWHCLFIIINKRRFFMKESVFNVLNYNRSISKISKFFLIKRHFKAWKKGASTNKKTIETFYKGNLLLKSWISIKIHYVERKEQKLLMGDIIGFRKYRNKMLMRKIFSFFREKIIKKKKIKYQSLRAKNLAKKRIFRRYFQAWKWEFQDIIQNKEIELGVKIFLDQRKKKNIFTEWKQIARHQTSKKLKLELYLEKKEFILKKSIFNALKFNLEKKNSYLQTSNSEFESNHFFSKSQEGKRRFNLLTLE